MDSEAVPVLAIIFGFVSFTVYLNYRVRMVKASSNSNNADLQALNDELKARTAQLEDRVQVLESIVTDKKHRLGEEIDSL